MKKFEIALSLVLIITMSQCTSGDIVAENHKKYAPKMFPIDGCSFFTVQELSTLSTITLDKSEYPPSQYPDQKDKCQYTGALNGDLSIGYRMEISNESKISLGMTKEKIIEQIKKTNTDTIKLMNDGNNPDMYTEASNKEVSGMGDAARMTAQKYKHGQLIFVNLDIHTYEFNLSVWFRIKPIDTKGIPFWEDKAIKIGKVFLGKMNNKEYKLKNLNTQ